MMTIVPKLAPKAVSVSVSPVPAGLVRFDTLSGTSSEATMLVHVAMPGIPSISIVVEELFLQSRKSLLLSS